jgi:HTH-type transcriptional regulator / antitoxin MqsA
MAIKCPICRGAELRVITAAREIGAPDGTVLAYTEELLECTRCSEHFYTRPQVLAASRNRAAALRTHDHFLTPAEIRDIRRRWGLSQAELEGMLGVGAKTVVRWERGAVCQSRAVDTLLRILEYFGPAIFDCVADQRAGRAHPRHPTGPRDAPAAR